MRRIILIVACGAALCLGMSPVGVLAAKHGKVNPIADKQRELKMKLQEGVKSGAITHQEAKRLKAEEKALRAEEKAAKANGKITAEERDRLIGELNHLGQEIDAQEKH